MITQIVKFNVKPEDTEAFKAALAEDKKGTDKEPGSVEMRLFAQNDNPNTIFAYERFADQAALDHHAAQPYSKTIFGLAQTALASAPEILRLGETKPAPDHSKSANSEDEVFVVFFIFKIKPEYKDRLVAKFEQYIDQTHKEPGNILFDLYTVEGANDTLAVYEQWRKASDLWDIHFKQPYADEMGALMAEAVVGDLKQYMSFVTEFA